MIQRDIHINQTETHQDTLFEIIEECTDDQDDYEKEKTAENKNEGAIYRHIAENEPETNQDEMKPVIQECRYDQDDEKKEKLQRIKMKV